MVDLTATYGAIPYPSRPLGEVTAFIVHHADGPMVTSEAGALAEIARIHVFHLITRDWPGFAYNGAIWRDTYYRCRPPTRKGWHSAGVDADGDGIGDWNEKGYAVCLLGDYTSTKPDRQTLRTILATKALIDREIGRPLELRAHRDGWATECPGSWWPATKPALLAGVV